MGGIFGFPEYVSLPASSSCQSLLKTLNTILEKKTSLTLGYWKELSFALARMVRARNINPLNKLPRLTQKVPAPHQ